MPALVIAAPASGSGKTTVTLGLLAALNRRGLTVAPFKVGPDFIDPGHHARFCGRPSRNLDGWMCGEQQVRETFRRGCEGANIAVIEGVMGLYDGASGDSDTGSTAEIARWLNAPILLTVDARSQARSAAALVKGFVTFDERLTFAGILFNRVGSARHAQLLREAVASTANLPAVLGCLPRCDDVAMAERHLGLITAEDGGNGADFYERLADWVEAHVDVDALHLPPFKKGGQGGFAANGVIPLNPPLAKGEAQVRIGVPRDAAFCFYYPENLELLAAAGAELVEFSPLSDAHLPEKLAGLYLGGGYPELYAEQLAKNTSLLNEIRRAANIGLPIYAECGGFIYLAAAVAEHNLCGIFPGQARLLHRRKALGYREVVFTADTPLGPTGSVARGHEFHYTELKLPDEVARCYQLQRRDSETLGSEGYRINNVLGSYVHLHFGSNPTVAANFVAFCEKYQRLVHHEGHEEIL
ncbi:MAG: cobyrinate a,c-diamide synthase [Desulfuromonadales bacterium]|nr:cobyrinate a,c-diamide synthase [Desulfuromonadales bacterium]